MSLDPLKLCRLCMNKCPQKELQKIDNEETSLDSVIFFCVDIKVQPGDGLPEVICLDCLKKVRMFYSFKRVCLEVDSRLKLKREKTNYVLEKSSIVIAKELSDSNETTTVPNYSAREIQDQVSNLILSDKINVAIRNKRINNINNSFQCEQCGRTFKLKTVLEKHMSIHTGIKPYVCKLCPKRFTRAENRMIHMRSHLGIKPYVCEICGSSSTKHQDLLRHMKVHSDERKYSCSLCGRHFKRSFDVNSHMRTHTGLRPFKCNICGKTYTSHSGLRKHYKNHCTLELNLKSK